MRVGTQSGAHGAKKGGGVGGNGHDDIVGDESIVTKVHAVGIIGGAKQGVLGRGGGGMGGWARGGRVRQTR